jgi:hypothetical protein
VAFRHDAKPPVSIVAPNALLVKKSLLVFFMLF